VSGLKHRAALMLGLRISEAVKIRIGDIDSGYMTIRVEEGKAVKTVTSPCRNGC
jgi:integrase